MKTTTLLLLLEKCKYKVLFLAFNTSVQEEIQSKIEERGLAQGKALTIHSLGRSAIKRRYRFRLEKGKNFKLIKAFQKKYKKHFKMPWEEKLRLSYTLMDMNDVSRMCLTDDVKEITKYALQQGKNLFLAHNLDKIWADFVVLRNEGYKQKIIDIDFNDMIYLPVVKKLYIPIDPTYLMIDEAQDLNLCQHALIEQLISQGDIEKWIAVGDRNQCQPKGTKILMKDLSEKNIEDLITGDEIISYDINKCQFVGNGKSWNAKAMKVLTTKINRRADNVFTFKLITGEESSYTSNHKCYVQLSEEKMKKRYVVYMMRKGVNYRLGISPCYTKFKSSAFAPVMRAKAEQAEDLWILKTFNTREEAYLHEQILSYKFRIPQTRFIDKTNSKRGLTQEHLDIFWHEFKNQEQCAKNILREFQKEIDFPLWSNTNSSQGGKGNSWKLSSKGMFKTQACNILPDIMEMCVFDPMNLDSRNRIVKKMVPIVSHKVELEVKEFISLDIEKNHNYVADGILTSNSIYGFSGAHSNSFDLFLDKGNVEECLLDICYRSDTEIIACANEVYDVMQPFSTDPGIVDVIDCPSEIKDKSMVICRNSNPLIDLYFQLLSNGKSCYIKGEDILNSVTRFMKPYSKYMIGSATTPMLNKMMELAKNTTDEGKMAYYIYSQNFKNFQRLCVGLGYGERTMIADLIEDVKKMFSNKKDAIMLCTIHKSKGLEADLVYIVNEHLMPSRFATSPEQLRQEKNLKYVGRSRAKHELYFLNI